MRRNLATLVIVLLALGLLIALNVVLMAEPRREESEASGDRSSYKGSKYGTLAYHQLLSESGHQVIRFEQPYTELAGSSVGTLLVVMPDEEHQPTQEELDALGKWVVGGGKLVVLDRYVRVGVGDMAVETTDRASGDVVAVVPSPLTRGAAHVKLSEYATVITDTSGGSVVHFTASGQPVVIERPVGDGSAIFVSDPFVIQNNGIAEGDNLALALNLVDGNQPVGIIGFDEYHHGYGGSRSAVGEGLRGYISGTPVPWIIGQVGLVALVIAVTRGRRLARAVPLARERRTGALVFVSSMANIQRLAKASDLAIDNIASSFRSRLCRYAGLPSNAPIKELARVAGDRSGVDPQRISSLLHKCEAALVGERPSQSELLALVTEIRTLEARIKL
jgi:hypothetical protein